MNQHHHHHPQMHHHASDPLVEVPMEHDDDDNDHELGDKQKLLGSNNNNNNNTNNNLPSSPSKSLVTVVASASPYAELLKLVFGAGGIYAAFLYYGSLQEDVFRYTAPDGTQFKQAWFLQVLEAAANIVVGYIGMHVQGPTPNVPLRLFAISGAAQVSAKACTSLALASGLSFPVATLAKSSKMAPVMGGTLLLGGATYAVREYLQVAAIIGGTAIVSMGSKKKKSGGDSSSLGLLYIFLALVLDGVTAGYQKRLQSDMAMIGVKPKPYDFMFWTNLFMCATALLIALGTMELFAGWDYVTNNPEIFSKILQFSACSAIGQSFIFYTLAHFDPLVLSTVTTTRKIFSVLLSILYKGHSLSWTGWAGVNLACLGIFAELQAKMASKRFKRHK